MDGQVGRHHFGHRRPELGLAKTERIIVAELRRRGGQEPDLFTPRKRDRGKLGIALRVRRETTLSVNQIATRLHLGTPASASVCLLAMGRPSCASLIQGRVEI